jgi:hypothetical protein
LNKAAGWGAIVRFVVHFAVVIPTADFAILICGARRWEREMSPMPGYELTEPWLTEEGLPKKGIWDVVYYAGGGHGRNGCKPMPKLRRALLQLVSARVVLVEWCCAFSRG